VTGRLALLAVVGIAGSVAPAAPAPGQLPPVTPPGVTPPGSRPPEEQPPKPPSNPAPNVPVNASDWPVYMGNPSRNQVSHDDTIFPPLGVAWSVDLSGSITYPVVAEGKVFATVGDPFRYGARVVALDARTGAVVWERKVETAYWTGNLAYGDGRLAIVDADLDIDVVRASDGQTVWSHSGGGSHRYPPIVAGGVLYASFGGGLAAFSMADGRRLWSVGDLGLLESIALDRDRVYATWSCEVIALSRATGERVWAHRSDRCPHPAGDDTPVLREGRVYTRSDGDAIVLEGHTGNPAGTFRNGYYATAFDGGRAFVMQRPLGAVDAGSGAPLWSFSPEEDPPYPYDGPTLGHVVVNHSVYRTGAAPWLYVLDEATGELRDAPPLPSDEASQYQPHGGHFPAIAAGQGVVVVPTGSRLTAYAALLRPPAGGIDMLSEPADVVTGGSLGLRGALARELQPGDPVGVTLESDRFPYGGYAPGGSTTTRPDRTFSFPATVDRNTRFRALSGGATSPPATAYALPRVSSRARSAPGGRIRLKVKLSGPRELKVGRGRVVHVYLVREGKSKGTRLGGARLRQTGTGRAAGTALFRAPRYVGENDTVVYCVTRLWELGFGRDDKFARRCGARRLSL
jgi:outer membrane protein assembly factor BamB